jgi:hypothetical protein
MNELEKFEKDCKAQGKNILDNIIIAKNEKPISTERLRGLIFEGLRLFDRYGNFSRFGVEYNEKKLENLSITDENIDKMINTLKRFIIDEQKD